MKKEIRFKFVVNNLSIKVVLSWYKVLNKVFSHYILSKFLKEGVPAPFACDCAKPYSHLIQINKTTLIAMNYATSFKPYYLIEKIMNKVIRFIFVVNNLAIKVVLSWYKVLNKVISHYIMSIFQNNYPLTNPAMPGLVKICMAIEACMKEGIPAPFACDCAKPYSHLIQINKTTLIAMYYAKPYKPY